jgi:hypothetical protein
MRENKIPQNIIKEKLRILKNSYGSGDSKTRIDPYYTSWSNIDLSKTFYKDSSFPNLINFQNHTGLIKPFGKFTIRTAYDPKSKRYTAWIIKAPKSYNFGLAMYCECPNGKQSVIKQLIKEVKGRA